MRPITINDITAASEYSFAVSEETIKLQGFTITFTRDTCAENPNDNEGKLPAMWFAGDTMRDYTNGALHRVLYDHFTLHAISRKWRAIANALEIDESAHDKEAREYAANYSCGLSVARLDVFQEALNVMRDDARGYRSYRAAIDYMNALEELCKLAGLKAVTLSSNGYCQGDTAQGLMVATLAWLKEIGREKITQGEFDHEASNDRDAYGAWLWGDVYGYSIERNGEYVDSCYGFYGSSGVESGLYENVVWTVNAEIAALKRRKESTLATLIKNRVPLSHRPTLLSAI